MGLLSFLFGNKNKSQSLLEFKNKGAVVIDVRSASEFSQGHVKGAKNMPLNTLGSKINDIKKIGKPIVVCCQSGMRSSQAASILKNHQIEVMNGGGWQSLNAKW